MKTIKRIDIKNFKSIINESFIIKNLNIFTGLNGVGKSSVIQSLLLHRQRKLNGDLTRLGIFEDILCSFPTHPETEIHISVELSDTSVASAKITKQDSLLQKEFTAPDQECALFSNNFHYLSASRISPALSYPSIEDISDNQIGSQGEYTIAFIEGNRRKSVLVDTLIINEYSSKYYDQINAWLAQISPNTRIKTDYHKATNSYSLHYEFYSQRTSTWSSDYRAINVGFGLTYMLPIIACILASKEGDLIIIENPESHLHPKGQSKMGEFLAYAAAGGIQLIIETHSDHIINGIRIALKDRKINASDIKCYFFSKEDIDKINICSINFLDDASLQIDAEVSDFFEQFDIDLRKILM